MNVQAVRPSAINLAETPSTSRRAAGSLVWVAAGGGLLIVAAWVRLYALELRPLHHDEGVNAYFMMQFLKEGKYHYDPANYHGPVLYYLAFVFARLQGLTVFAMRMGPALCGVATVWLALCLRRYLGTLGALAAAALLAISPGAVYMSRYFIHESLFVFFTFAVIVAGFRCWETGRAAYLMCASVAAALAFATKETVLISAGVLVPAIFLAPLLIDIRKTLRARYGSGQQSGQGAATETHGQVDSRVSGRGRREIIRAVLRWVAAVALFILVIAFFYSSMFAYSHWLGDVLKSYTYWARTSRSDQVQHWYTYLWWLTREEGLLLLLGLGGVGLILWRSSSRFLVYVAVWLCGLLVAYSILPYKTPWLALNFIIPMAIAGGYGVNAFSEWAAPRAGRATVAGLLAAAMAVMFFQMMRLNFWEYDDDRHPYVYAHTRRELLSMTDEISKIAERAGTGQETTILITASEYWPLPWYLRDYRQVAYTTEVRDLDTAIVIGLQDQESEMRVRLREHYDRVAAYVLRPGVNFVLYVRHAEAAGAQINGE
ncbi:MAG TPA: flippase activity-associated protein Agl23 [Blastocatellia bacterium]|nr:flippase activity-associated protein Agl23 [Blastocatellia bacterium]